MEKFWIVLGVVICSAIVTMAESAAKSDPGQTYYVNSGIGRQYSAGRYGNFAAGDVNEYGYKHFYGVPKKSYSFRYKQPVQQQFPITFPLTEGQHQHPLLAQPLEQVSVEELQPLDPQHQAYTAPFQHQFFQQGILRAAPNSQFFIQSDSIQPGNIGKINLFNINQKTIHKVHLQPVVSTTAHTLTPLDPVTPLQAVSAPQHPANPQSQPFQHSVQFDQFSQIEPAEGYQQFVQLQQVTQLEQVDPVPVPAQTPTPLPFVNRVSPLPLLHQVAQDAFAQPTHRPFVAFRQPTNTVPSIPFSFNIQQIPAVDQAHLMEAPVSAVEEAHPETPVEVPLQHEISVTTPTSIPLTQSIDLQTNIVTPAPFSIFPSVAADPVLPTQPVLEEDTERDPVIIPQFGEQHPEPLVVTPPAFVPQVAVPHLLPNIEPQFTEDERPQPPPPSAALTQRAPIRLQFLEAVPSFTQEEEFGAKIPTAMATKQLPPGPELTIINLDGDSDSVTQPTTRFPPRIAPVRPLPAFPAVP